MENFNNKEDFSWAQPLPTRRDKRKKKKVAFPYREDTIDLTRGIVGLGHGQDSRDGRPGMVRRPILRTLLAQRNDIKTPGTETVDLEGVKTAFIIPVLATEEGDTYIMIEDEDKKASLPGQVKLKFPGGGIDGAETVLAGAYRELTEEVTYVVGKRNMLPSILKEENLRLVARIDLPSNIAGTHSIAIFMISLPAFMKAERFGFGKEQCGLFPVNKEDIEEAIRTHQILPQHSMAWSRYMEYIGQPSHEAEVIEKV